MTESLLRLEKEQEYRRKVMIDKRLNSGLGNKQGEVKECVRQNKLNSFQYSYYLMPPFKLCPLFHVPSVILL